MNLYAYVGNDPLNKFDPTGLAGEDAGCGSKYYCALIGYDYNGENRNDKWEVRTYTEQGQPVSTDIHASNNSDECRYGTRCPTQDQLDKRKSESERENTPSAPKPFDLSKPLEFEDDKPKKPDQPQEKPKTPSESSTKPAEPPVPNKPPEDDRLRRKFN